MVSKHRNMSDKNNRQEATERDIQVPILSDSTLGYPVTRVFTEINELADQAGKSHHRLELFRDITKPKKSRVHETLLSVKDKRKQLPRGETSVRQIVLVSRIANALKDRPDSPQRYFVVIAAMPFSSLGPGPASPGTLL
ncbi:hypothetical protein AAG570_006786 [Ranatra chinensis]|uniref:Uncharacterized protein n=1 Tax=Ranatra chinensis TaxID=642074 RepID=A0ABD0YV26_9HEMI